MPTVSTCLWYDSEALAAATYYCQLLGGEVTNVVRTPPGGRADEGSVMVVEWTLAGQRFTNLNGGPVFPHTEAASIQVYCDTQDEADRHWYALTGDGGQEGQCGWLKDRWGLSWQIIPVEALALITDPDRGRAQRATEAMFTLGRLDVAVLRTAADGDDRERGYPEKHDGHQP